MIYKCTEWPKVLPNDDGIRPAGSSDQCFYCGKTVGENHRYDCVCVQSKVKYTVYMDLDDGRGKREVGTFERLDPYFWSHVECEFHKNESSWCADNALDAIKWNDSKDAEALEQWMKDKDLCSCGPLSFEYAETVDAGPFIQLREPVTNR